VFIGSTVSIEFKEFFIKKFNKLNELKKLLDKEDKNDNQ